MRDVDFDLYDSTKLDDDCRRRLREFDGKSQSFSDGEMFRNIRHFQLDGDTVAARQWLTTLKDGHRLSAAISTGFTTPRRARIKQASSISIGFAAGVHSTMDILSHDGATALTCLGARTHQ